MEAYQFQQPQQRRIAFKSLALFFFVAVVAVLGTLAFTNNSALFYQQEYNDNIISRDFNTAEALVYSRILSVCLNFDHSMSETQASNVCEIEAVKFSLYPLKQNDYHITFALTIDDLKKATLNDTKSSIKNLKYSDFPSEEIIPIPEIFYVTLKKRDFSFIKLKASQTMKQETEEKIRQIIIQLTPEMKRDYYNHDKKISVETNLGKVTPKYSLEKKENEIIATKEFTQDDVDSKNPELSLGNNEYFFKQSSKFSTESKILIASTLDESYHYESQPTDALALGFDIETYSEIQFISKKQISDAKKEQLKKAKKNANRIINNLIKKVDAIEQRSIDELAQKVKDTLLVNGIQDNIIVEDVDQNTAKQLVHQEIQVYKHQKQSILGFDFTIKDVIDIFQNNDDTDMKGILKSGFLFQNQLVFTVARHGCSQDIVLFKIQANLNSNFTADLAQIEAIPEEFMVGLQQFVVQIMEKYQAFIKQFKKDDFHETTSQQETSEEEEVLPVQRNVDPKQKIDEFIQKLKDKIAELDNKIKVLLQDSKEAHFEKPISYSYPLNLEYVTITFGFDLTFGMDASYRDNLETLYEHNKFVIQSYLDIIKQEYQKEVDAVQSFIQQMRVDLQDAEDYVKTFKLTLNEKIVLKWTCTKDESESNETYVCVNHLTQDIKKVEQAYYAQLQKEIQAAQGKLDIFIKHVKEFEQQQLNYFKSLDEKLKYFWDLRKTMLYDKLNFTFQPTVQGDIYIKGSASIRFSTPLPIFDMEVSVHGNLLDANATASVAIDAKLIITQLFNLVKDHTDVSNLTPAQKEEFKTAISNDSKVSFNLEIKGIDMKITWKSSPLIEYIVKDIVYIAKDIFTKVNSAENGEQLALPDRKRILVEEQNGLAEWIMKKKLDKFFQNEIKKDTQKLYDDVDHLLDAVFCDFLVGKWPFPVQTGEIDLIELLWLDFTCKMPWVGILDLNLDKIQCHFEPKFQVKVLI